MRHQVLLLVETENEAADRRERHRNYMAGYREAENEEESDDRRKENTLQMQRLRRLERQRQDEEELL